MAGKSKYTFNNERYLRDIDSEEKAYFLGLIFADGSLNDKLKTLQLTLVSDDREVLDFFVKKVYKDRGLRTIYPRKREHKEQSQMTVTSSVFYSDLKIYNLNQNKSVVGNWVNENFIPKELMRHFIRGYFDGDGCIYHNPKTGEKTVSFTGNKVFIENLRRLLIVELRLKRGNMSMRHKEGNSITLTFGGANQVSKIKEYLYKAATIYLTRKLIKFNQIL